MMSRKSSARTAGPLSMGFPDPLNTRPANTQAQCCHPIWVQFGTSYVIPNMSSDTGVRKMSPVNSQLVFLASIPEVPSNTCRGQSGGQRDERRDLLMGLKFQSVKKYIKRQSASRCMIPKPTQILYHLRSFPPVDERDLENMKPRLGAASTCTTALEPFTSSTCPLLWVPSGSVRWTISAYLGNCRSKTGAHGDAEDKAHPPVEGPPHLHLIQNHQRPVDARDGFIGWRCRGHPSCMHQLPTPSHIRHMHAC